MTLRVRNCKGDFDLDRISLAARYQLGLLPSLFTQSCFDQAFGLFLRTLSQFLTIVRIPGGAQVALHLGWRLGDRFSRGAQFFDPKIERTATDAQLASNGRSGPVAMDVHLHGGFFEFLVIDTSLFTWGDHSAIELCPLPPRLSIKWGELQELQVKQMGHTAQTGQAA